MRFIAARSVSVPLVPVLPDARKWREVIVSMLRGDVVNSLCPSATSSPFAARVMLTSLMHAPARRCRGADERLARIGGIPRRSPLLTDLENKRTILLVGAMYDLSTGTAEFLG